MDMVKYFIKKHLKKIILGAILFILTFGGYGLYKWYKRES